MGVVGGHQRDVQLLAHLQKLRVHQALVRNPVVLQFQEIVALAEAFLVLPGGLPGLLRQVLHDVALHFPRKAGGQRDQPLMVTVQDFHVHPGLVIIPFREALADNLHQVGVAGVVLRQQDKMVVPVLAAGGLFVETGVGRYIDLAANDRVDALFLRRPVEVDDAVHDAMVRDGGAVHAQLLHPGDILFDFIGTVQEGVFRVDVEMYECHMRNLLLSSANKFTYNILY